MPEGTVSDDKPLIQYGSDAYNALKDIVLDAKLMDEMCYCADYMHTYKIESFNSLRLKYLSKRTAFSYSSMVTASMVAALDYNYHLKRDYRVKEDGTPLLHRKFNPRSKRLFVSNVKQAKDYPYVPAILALVRKFATNPECVPEMVRMADFDPATIAPTIRGLAETNTPSLELLKEHVSRFSSL